MKSGLIALAAMGVFAGTEAAPLAEFKGPQTFDGRLGTMERLADVPRLTAFTLAAWVNVTGDGEGDKPYGRIIDGPGFFFHVATSLRKRAANSVLAGNTRDFFGLTFGIPLDNGTISSWSSGQIAKAGQWVHVALLVPDGEKTLPKLFVNGKATGLFRDVRPRPTPIAGGTYTIANAPGGKRPFEGRLAAVAIHEWELSADEIAALAAKDPEGNPPQAMAETFTDELPIADISHDAARQTVIAAGTEETYQGHPTTLLADDGKTMFCVWTINHGGGCGPFAKSTDGGRTWTRIDGEMPADFKFHRNCPTLQKVPRPDGGFNFCVYSANCKPGAGGGLGILASADGGATWKVMPPAPQLESGMPPTGFMQLKDGSCALFGQHRKVRGADDAPTSDQDIWMAVSKDGGLTWGEPRIVATADQKNLCEPCCLRSPDGAELCLLIRENRHTARSMMCFSRDEGRTWTKPVDTPWGLTGDRHEAVLLPDGRYVIAFRDQALGSSTWGQYVAWVGTWADIRACRPGQYRIHLLEHQGGRRPSGGYLSGDTGYSGVELLPDGTIVCTTYMKYWADARKHSVVTTRFRIAETDAMVNPVRCVTELGVRGDGGADAAAPLNAALKAGKVNLYFPAGEYRLEGQLVLPSHAHLVADPAARIYAGPGCAPQPVVVNADPARGDEDIVIRGGLWDGCAPFHPRRGWTDPDYPARFFHFIKVKDLVLEKLKMKDAVAYHISLGQIRGFRIEDIEFLGVFPVKCQDGVHICGGCEDGLVRNIRCPVRGATYDDLIAVNADDCQFYSHQSGQIDAPIRRLLIENVEAVSCHSIVRLLSVRSPIENVVFRNIRGGYREYGVNADAARYCADPLFKDADCPDGVGCLRNILFENCEMWYDGPRPNPKEVVDFEENGTGVRFRGFRHAREKEKPGLKPRPTFRFRKLGAAKLIADGKAVAMERGEERTFDDVRDLDFNVNGK